MKEATLQTAMGHWLKAEGSRFFNSTAVFELKIEKTHRFAFNKVKQHQVEGLQRAQDGLYHKITDAPIFSGQQTRFTAKKPFDCVYFTECRPFVVLMFYIPRAKKVIHVIPIGEYLQIVEGHDKKSITDLELRQKWHLRSYMRRYDITKYFRADAGKQS